MGTHESKKVTHLVWLWVRRILLGLLVLLVATEIALRTLSTWNPFRLPDPPPKGDEELTVLCVGDSFTYGMGAPRGESYPDHLQEMLGPTVRVVNRGWPGANSALMAAYLPAWLAEEEPDLVLVMAGINNKHNPLGGTYQALVDAGYHVPAFGETAKRRLDELLWRFRSYRMLRWQLRGEEFGEVEALARDADPAEVYSYVLRRQAYGYREWNRLFYKGAGANELPAGIEEGASAETIQAALPAIVTALTAVEDADDLTEWHHNLYHATRRTLAPREAERFVGELRARLPGPAFDMLTAAPDFLAANHPLAHKMLWFDLAQMHRACRARKATRLAVLSYPFGMFAHTLASFAFGHQVAFLDNAAFFPAIWPEGLRHDDGHLTSEGYRLLARSVLSQARELGLLPPSVGHAGEPASPAGAAEARP